MHAGSSPSEPFVNELNAQQRDGGDRTAPATSAHDTRPLLVIAGAGSGKTNTLAHRVANLIRHGADPQRMMLLTFSRRAAQEMERRVGGVLQQALGLPATQALPSLPWTGTFHSIGARLLREYAGRIGLEESFTIHDRGDAEDLMGMVRHEIGLAETKNRFPLKGTCLGIYSRVLNTRDPLDQVLQDTYPWCSQWESELKKLFGAYVEAKQQQNVLDYDDLLLFWAEMMASRRWRRRSAQRFDHLLVDEYQDTNRLQSADHPGDEADGRGRHGGRRRRAEHLLVPRRHGAQHPGLSAPVHAAGAHRHAGAQLPQHAAHPGRQQCRDRRGARAPRQESVDRQGVEPAARSCCWCPTKPSRRAGWPTRCCGSAKPAPRSRARPCCFAPAPTAPRSSSSWRGATFPFVKFGGLKFLEAAHVKDVLAVLRFAQNPRGRMAGFRVAQLIPGIGQATATRLLDAMARGGGADADAAAVRAAGAGAAGVVAVRRAVRATARPDVALARRPGTGEGLVPAAAASACTTTRRCASSTSSSWCGWPPATPAASASSPS